MTDTPERNTPGRGESDLGRLAERLRDPDVWAEPPADLEHHVVTAVLEAASSGGGRHRRSPAVLLAAAAVVALLVGVGAVVTIVGPGAGDSDSGLAVALSGTELAGSATATAKIDRTPGGTKILLDVDELQPAEPGSYYQAWVTKGETTVSAGSFHLRRGGGVVELWCGLDDPIGATLVVSLERYGPGDDPMRSGPSDHVVLVGTITDR